MASACTDVACGAHMHPGMDDDYVDCTVHIALKKPVPCQLDTGLFRFELACVEAVLARMRGIPGYTGEGHTDAHDLADLLVTLQHHGVDTSPMTSAEQAVLAARAHLEAAHGQH